jgi:phosphohistidine phosphatase
VLELVEGLPEARETVSCVVLVGHQPWIGEVAARLISGGQASWSVRKAAVWWLVRRMRSGEAQWTVRTVTDPDYS